MAKASAQSLPAHTGVQVNDMEATKNHLDELTRQRDERPVRLRE